jgi:hypothetical protein
MYGTTMPRTGFKSITIKENLLKELEAAYEREKVVLANEGVGSLTSYVSKIISHHLKEKERDQSRLKHFNIYENVIRIQDSKLNRLVDVDYRHGEMFCGLCHSTECLHTGFAWSIYSHYNPMGSGESRRTRHAK